MSLISVPSPKMLCSDLVTLSQKGYGQTGVGSETSKGLKNLGPLPLEMLKVYKCYGER